MQVAFFCGFKQGVAGMSWDLGRDVPDLEKLYARKLCADFSYPILQKACACCPMHAQSGGRFFTYSWSFFAYS